MQSTPNSRGPGVRKLARVARPRWPHVGPHQPRNREPFRLIIASRQGRVSNAKSKPRQRQRSAQTTKADLRVYRFGFDLSLDRKNLNIFKAVS
jgi:hypothetical protein